MLTTVILKCLKSEVNHGENNLDLSELNDAQLKELYQLAKRHDLLHFVAKCLGERNQNREAKRKFDDSVFLALYRYEQKKYVMEQIENVLDKCGVEHVFLKGAILCKYYPEPWMRTSCDIDVLVKKECLQNAVELLSEKLGYKVGKYDSHDISLYTQEGVHIELHYTLIEVMDNVDEILKNVWNYVEKVEEKNNQYYMPDELFYFYHMAHMAKHFLHGGCGVRSVLDVWILNHRVEYDKKKRYELLAQGKLLSFARQIEYLSEVWFDEEEHNDLSKLLEEYIFFGGLYGNVENKVSVQRSQGDSRFVFVLKRLFMPYKEMSLEYPILKKRSYLLPIYWVVRWIKCMSPQRVAKAKKEFQANKLMSKEKKRNSEKLIQTLELDILNG